MALSSDAREFLAKSLFGLSAGAPFDVNEYTIHICTSIDLDSTYAEVSAASKGSTIIGSTTSAIAAEFEWDASLNVGGGSSDTGAIKNSNVITVAATGAGTVSHMAITEEDASKVVLVQAFTNPVSYAMLTGDEIRFGSGSIQIEIE